jgi:outer membrane protein assembly factor BamB
LWSSITEALDGSGWFVLLLSEEAAQSEWVNREVEYWVANKDPARIIPVVTDGDFGWADGDIDASSTAAPPALSGVFGEEPRWADLRWARTDEHLDLSNPRFSDAVADIASALRGVPKDELASEEVRQHRRTIRTAWAAGLIVVALGVAAVVFGIQSASNAAAAEANAQLAQARELAASAIGVVDADPVLAKLLALEAIQRTPAGVDQPVEVINSLWQAAAADRLISVIETGFDGTAKPHLSSDGSRLAVTSSVGDLVRLYETDSMSLLWEWTLGDGGDGRTVDTVWYATISNDNSRVAVGVWDETARFGIAQPEAVDDPRPNRVVILDGGTGSELHTLTFEGCSGAHMGIWSLDDGRLAVPSGYEPCVRPGAPSGYWVEVFDTATWQSQALLDLPLAVERFGPVPEFDADGRMFVFGPRITEVYDTDYLVVETLEDSFGVVGDVTRDGSMIVSADLAALRVTLFDVETGQRLTYLTPFEFARISHGARFSSDESFVIYGNDTPQTMVWDVASAEVAFLLPGGTAEWVHLDEERMLAYTGHADGQVKVWNLQAPATGRQPVGDLGDASWVDANSFALGPELGAFVADDLATGRAFVRFFDLSTGVLVDSPVRRDIEGHNPDRETELDRIVPMLDGRFIYNDVGQWTAHNPRTGEERVIVGCESDDFQTCRETGEPLWVLAASVDGTEIVARPGGDGEWLFFDGHTGEPTGQEGIEAPEGILTFTDEWVAGFNDSEFYAIDRATGETLLEVQAQAQLFRGDVSASGRLIVMQDFGSVVVVETDTWDMRRIDLESGTLRGLSISPDEATLAVGDETGIHIVDLATDTLTQLVGVPDASDIHWLAGNELLVGTSGGSWATVSLDVEDLVDDVANSLLLGFSDQECLTYKIDPCPTLEEIRNRG